MNTQRADGSLSLVGVQKNYGRHCVLNDVSFDAASGEFVTVLGPSGSGKSTLLRIIAMFSDASGGDVLIEGTSILQRPLHRRNVGLVFQNYALFPHMSERENVSFAFRMRKIPKAEIDRRVDATLGLVELSGFAERYLGQLTGGQQQRVALARTLIFEPRVLLLDEPMGALEKKFRELMGAELRRIHQELGITVFHVTHNVVLPQMKPALLTGGLFAFLTSWDELVMALFLSGTNAKALPRQMWNTIQFDRDPTLAAISTLLLLLPISGFVTVRLLQSRTARKVA